MPQQSDFRQSDLRLSNSRLSDVKRSGKEKREERQLREKTFTTIPVPIGPSHHLHSSLHKISLPLLFPRMLDL